MPEIADFALILLPVAGGLVLAILSSRLSDRLPIPAPGIFLLVAAGAADIWPQLGSALSIQAVERIAVVALVIILLNGGMDIGWRRMWESAGPVLSLGVLGTFATAALIAVAAHVILGFSWTLAGILGAALAPTDPAVVFSVLGGTKVGARAGTILEGEAGVNDPAGIALMIGMIELATHADASFLVVVQEFAVQMGVGLALGIVSARVLLAVTDRVRLASEELRPVLLIALAMVLYAVTSLVGGSGFLAVFVAGLVLGDARLPATPGVGRFNQSLAGLSEIVVFVALGLTVDLTDLPAATWRDGAVLTILLALLVRPLVVTVTLAGAKVSRRDQVFIAWSGLKGAVPILLAAFAVLGDVPGAEAIYGVVFVAVLFSVFAQGSLVPAVARTLRPPHD
ncbi:MAG TPA: cation:proton antiporter [Solirubrobacteraceae bacterium]|nr:cation:proton antiporter [Solirubrobacteraceae bacterium]